MTFISVDAETNGLYGDPFAIGAYVTERGEPRAELLLRCRIRGPVDSWVRENVLPALRGVEETHIRPASMLDELYEFYMRWGGRDADTLTHVRYPVEVSVFRAVFARPERRRHDPFPLLDVATLLWARGHDPTDVHGYVRRFGLDVPVAGRPHNPLYDAAAAFACFAHLNTTAV